jgi:hypothetical protein
MTPDEYRQAFESIPLKTFHEMPDGSFLCHAINGAQVRVEAWQNHPSDQARRDYIEDLRDAFSPDRNINMKPTTS